MLDASVVIATRDRAVMLERALRALLAQDVPDSVAWEVVIVDNNSRDATRTLVVDYSKRSPVPIRYRFEPKLGLSYAQNAGIAEAQGAILAFIDDDVTVDRRWLATLVEAFRQDPALGLLAGGVVVPEDHVPRLAFTRGETEMALLPHRPLAGLVLGCNLSVRRTVLSKVRGFDTRLGAGRGLSCNDIDFSYRILTAGFRGRFCPAALVYHRPAPRTRTYLRGWGAFYVKFMLRGDLNVGRQAWWEVRRLWRGLGWRKNARSSVREARELAAGGGIMVGRMLWSLVTGRDRTHQSP